MISIRDELGTFGKRLDDVTKSSKRDVDGVSFFLSLLIDSSFGRFLRAG